MPQADLNSQPPKSELQPGQSADRVGVRVDEGAHIARDHVGVVVHHHDADALAEPRDVGPSDRTPYC
ncbi:MAG: hypothetical protein M3P18_16345 [Actinomycetota bacterium]|nr:hypothetical protein [Actinomycetota bacterium]